MNKIIKQLIENGISVRCEFDTTTKSIEFVINGFYKSGDVRLVERDDTLIAISRYNKENVINELRDVVELNYSWWQSSKDRFDGWIKPDSDWIPLLKKYKFITENINITYT